MSAQIFDLATQIFGIGSVAQRNESLDLALHDIDLFESLRNFIGGVVVRDHR